MSRGAQGPFRGLAASWPAAAIVVLALSVVPAHAQLLAYEPEAPPSGVVFQSVYDLQQKTDGTEPMLRGGRVADSKVWPASFYMVSGSGPQRSSCTGALIGPRVLLTAAHCVPADGKLGIAFGRAPPQTATCVQHPAWVKRRDRSADFALCAVPQAIVAQDLLYETVYAAPVAVLLGNKIVLSGYGCTDDIVAKSRDQTIAQARAEAAAARAGRPAPKPDYRFGFATAAETSQSTARADRRQFYAPYELYNIITDLDGANLCPGDSGGPVFRLNPARGSSFERRGLVAVNSRVLFLNPDDPKRYGASLLAAVGATGRTDDEDLQPFAVWAKTWASQAGVDICGLAETTSPTCRGV